MIILEFELEHDIFNPLYPAFSQATRSGSESPATVSSFARRCTTNILRHLTIFVPELIMASLGI